MSPFRLWPRMVSDLVPRSSLILLATAVVLAPLYAVSGGMSTGGASHAGLRALPTPLITLHGLLTVGAALALWDGVVSGPRRDGSFRFLFSRPASRSAFYGAEHLARIAWIVPYGIALAWVLGVGCCTGLARAAITSLVTGAFVGGLTVLASALLDRGEALGVTAILLVERAVRPGGIDPDAVLGSFLLRGASALLSPVSEFYQTVAALSAGRPPDPGGSWLVLLAGASSLALGLGIASCRQLPR